MPITNYKQDGVDIGGDLGFEDAWEKVQSNREKFPQWYLDQIDPVLYPDGDVPGALWSWGYDTSGALGQNVAPVYTVHSPVQVGTLTNWRGVSCSALSTKAIKTDGTMWAWGSGGNGQHGDGTLITRSSPVQVGSLTNWNQVSSGVTNAMSIKTDGTLWGTGYNQVGALGLGTISQYSAFTQVGTLTNWKQVSCNDNFSAMIKTDGTLWVSGQTSLGISNSSPVQVGTLTNWKSVSTERNLAFSVKTDGTLWVWGSSGHGALGLGATYETSSPMQVGTLMNWKQVAVGSNINRSSLWTLAVKTDGTLWAWGENSTGVLGLGDRTNRSSPTQVGSLTNWKSVSTGNTSGSPSDALAIAVKTDGTLWTWGYSNAFSSIRTSSPIQVGSLTTWKTAVASYSAYFAIK